MDFGALKGFWIYIFLESHLSMTGNVSIFFEFFNMLVLYCSGIRTVKYECFCSGIRIGVITVLVYEQLNMSASALVYV